MATYQELRTRSQQVRDEQNIGGNTALRVGQLLMDIVKYFNDNDAAASEYLQQHFAMVNDGTHLLNWQQSPIVILHTMGETYDEGDFSSLSQGENYYRNGFIVEANGQGGGINGETPKVNVLYVNLANDTLYTWNGASFDAITSGGGGGISGDDILKNAYYLNGNLVLVFETENGDKTVSIPVNFDASNYVPTSRTVNGKALSSNITLSQSDIPGLVAALAAKVGYSDGEWLQVKAGAMQAASAVPNTTTVNGKQLNDNIVIGMADIPGLLQAIANAGSGAVSVTTNQDGTFVIHVGSTDYTVNLNHTHPNMAKLVVCEESDLPSTLEDDTIYGVVDAGEISMLYMGGYPFYGGGGGGGSTEPALREPAAGSVIDMGEYASGTLEATVKVKGRKLTEALTVEIDGTGFAFAQTQPSGVTVVSATELTVTAEAANTLSGVDIAVVYTGTQYNAQGTFGVNSSEVSRECVIRASYISLPSGYTACEYIANGNTINNNIYINTGVDVTSSLRIVGKYKVAPSKAWQALFGMYLNDNAHYRCMSGTDTYPIIFMIKGSSFGTEYRVADTSPHEFDVSKERLIFDGVEYQSEASSEWTTDKKLYLFSMNNAANNNASEGAMPNCRVYYFKMYNGSSLVRNFRPAYEQSTQKYGMYDLVHGVFYPSSGSGNFSGQQITQ